MSVLSLERVCLAVATWLAYRGVSDVRSMPRVAATGAASTGELVSIIVPARNEERSIELCVRSLLAQESVTFELIVVDDRSTDTTRSILRELEAEFPFLRVVDGGELAEGWVGKPWALFQGVRVATGDWLLFTDADSYHVPSATAAVATFVRDGNYDALSLATGQDVVSFWERALLPSILGMVLIATGPIAAVNDPARPDRAVANGQYIFVRREAYHALGGHEALRGEIVEDIEFARRIKRDGRFRYVLAGGADIVRVRMYHSLREIWDGFTKNAFVGTHGNIAAALGGIAFTSVVSWLPYVLIARALLRRRKRNALEASAAASIIIASSMWGMRQVGLPARLGMFAPMGIAFLGAVTANSMIAGLSGRGVEWRGRRYTGMPSHNARRTDGG